MLSWGVFSSIRQIALVRNPWELVAPRGNVCPAFDGQDFAPLNTVLSELPSKLTLNFCSVDNGYVWIASGQDGVIFSERGEPVEISLRFRDRAMPLPAADDLRVSALRLDFDLFVSVDAASWRNYYHWLCLAVPKMMIARELPAAFVRPVIPDYRDGAVYSETVWRQSLEICGLSESVRLPAGLYHAPRVTTITVSYPRLAFLSCFPAFDAAFNPLRVRLCDDPSSPRRIFVQRAGRDRLTINETRLVEGAAHRRGFVSVRLEALDFLAQACLFHNAEAVIAPHGAGLSNLVFGKSSLAVLEINRPLDPPEEYLRPWFYLLARARSQRYSFLNATDLSAERVHEAIDRLLSKP